MKLNLSKSFNKIQLLNFSYIIKSIIIKILHAIIFLQFSSYHKFSIPSNEGRFETILNELNLQSIDEKKKKERKEKNKEDLSSLSNDRLVP